MVFGNPQAGGFPAPEGLDAIRGARILLVEDNPANQILARDVLLHGGFQVDVAVNGEEAVRALAKAGEPYAAVLMDVQMPIMDGIEATRIIREDPANSSLPIIAVTANARSRDRENCLSAGADECLDKPLDIATLFDTLIRLIPADGGAPGRAEGGAPGTWHEDERGAPPVRLPKEIAGVDLEAGLARAMGKRPLFARLLIEFAAAYANTGRELAAAARTGDLERVRFVAHGLKSTAGNIGADAVRKAADSLEAAIAAGEDELAGLLESFNVELDAVVNAIEASGIELPAARRRAGQTPFDEGEARRLAGVLETKLQANELDADGAFGNLAGMLAGRGVDALLDELAERIEALDFAAAHEVLSRVVREL